MPRKRKVLTDSEIAKLREIETYEHANNKRTNNPPVGMAQHDKSIESNKSYSFDPNIDPELQWAGKKEGLSFDVSTSSIHIHESIKPHKIIKSVQTIGDEEYEGHGQQISMFETPVERMKRRRDAIEFYQHGINWTNRMIAGDSLIVMNSLIEKEGMAGQVQMVYIDPPYGIKYGSNFQPFVSQATAKDRSDDDLSSEPEMLTAFRDTWELGIHSYLTYLRNRLLLARELLSDSGSVFVQISEENLHHVRELCDEIFGPANLVTQIFYQKTTGAGSPNELLTPAKVGDYIVWYAKDIFQYKYHKLFKEKVFGGEGSSAYKKIELSDGTRMSISEWEKEEGRNFDYNNKPAGSRLYALDNLTSQSGGENARFPIKYNGKEYTINRGSWKTSKEGIDRLLANNRIDVSSKGGLGYIRYYDDFSAMPITSLWTDTVGQNQFGGDKVYVVQTALTVLTRCILMATDPGDLVLDITCGSGTTALMAEQWGRRWITCDTSRIAIALAKKRLMTATFDYYKLAHEDQGVDSGFVYKTLPHITLKSIANNLPAPVEFLYDQPEIDKTKIRITGPFTVEALPAPTVKPLDSSDMVEEKDFSTKQTEWRDQLLATGILGRGGNRLEFSRVEPLSGTTYLQAEAETKEANPRRAVVCFASETRPMDSRMVAMAMDEVETLRPAPKIVIFAAFQFDPEASKDISETKWPGVECFCVQMNTDLMTEDLKKKRSSDQSFWFVGQPDVELVKDGRSNNRYKVKVHGFDYYDVKKGTVESGNTSRIAMWMLDTDYDGMCIEPMQVFFPMGGQNDGWKKLAKTLKAEIDQELIEQYEGTESLWFVAQPNSRIAVKIIDDRGIESLKIIRIGEE